MAAAAGRFGTPGRTVRSPAGGFPHAFHLDARLYAAHLRTYSEARGIERVEGRIVDVRLRSEDGFVQSVQLADGREIEGDLFLDCSGGRALLIAGAMGIGYQDWSEHLPCNRAVVAPSENVGEPAPYTRATARSAGWQWRIPLQHRAGNGYVYSTAFSSDEEAERVLLQGIEGEPLAAPHRLSFATGRRPRFWERNVVALGLSSGFLEPLESTSIHLIQTGIAKLLSLFPDTSFKPALARAYDRQMAAAFEGVRDFIILHYKATARADSPFWNHVREMPIPESLLDRIELFRSTGRFVPDENELFSPASWFAVMLGQGIIPEGYSPLVDSLDPRKLQVGAEDIRRRIAEAVDAMPTHAEHLRSLGPAEKAA